MASQTPPGWARDFSPTAKNSTATRILVVDDEPLVRWSVSETLGSLGWEVLEAGDGQSAIRAVSDRLRHVDVVFLDLWLPDSNDTRPGHRCPRRSASGESAEGDAAIVAQNANHPDDRARHP